MKLLFMKQPLNTTNLFIRVDVLVKRNNYIKLYEVKAKSIDLTDNSFQQSLETRFLQFGSHTCLMLLFKDT